MNDSIRTMRAVRASSSDPASLTSENIPVPDPGPGELLVEVRGTAVTAGELTWPESWPAIPCHDLSGVVAATGDGADGWRPGDEVYGLVGFDRPGAAAEYVTAPAADLAPKPASVDHLQAAAVPLGALTAWQALHEHAQLSPGQHVLVHGGAGGVGAYAVQLAALAGAQVTATASARNAAFAAELGARDVLDYSGRFEDQVRDVDVVIDPVGGTTTARSWPVMRDGGILVAIAEEPDPDRGGRGDVRAVYFVVRPDGGQLRELAALVDKQQLRPAVSTVFELADLPAAFRAQRAGRPPGKVVIRVSRLARVLVFVGRRVFVLVATVGGIPAGRHDLLIRRYRSPVDPATPTSPGCPHNQPQHHTKRTHQHQDVTDRVDAEAVRGDGRDPEPEDGSHRDKDKAGADRHGSPPMSVAFSPPICPQRAAANKTGGVNDPRPDLVRSIARIPPAWYGETVPTWTCTACHPLRMVALCDGAGQLPQAEPDRGTGREGLLGQLVFPAGRSGRPIIPVLRRLPGAVGQILLVKAEGGQTMITSRCRPTASFDVTISDPTVHYIARAAKRGQTLCKVLRIFRVGGCLSIVDDAAYEYTAVVWDAASDDVTVRRRGSRTAFGIPGHHLTLDGSGRPAAVRRACALR